MTHKETWFLILEADGKRGIGECGILRGLSFDDQPDYQDKLRWVCLNIHLGVEVLFLELQEYPSIKFGLEQAFLSLNSDNPFHLFKSDFVHFEKPIEINGLIWMGSEEFMLHQIEHKLAEGFGCLKMKIGAIDFKTEIGLLRSIRNEFSSKEIELRVDANGAFEISEAIQKLEALSALDIHSIEQPIKSKQWQEMASLCEKTPLPIALDEELIGIVDVTERQELLQTIKPQYIILKPSLIGGFLEGQDWIDKAEKLGVGWWVTSALESNIGLNAIAQWTYTLNSDLPQGLGTGSLFTNNFPSPLDVQNGKLFYRNGLSWRTELIDNLCT